MAADRRWVSIGTLAAHWKTFKSLPADSALAATFTRIFLGPTGFALVGPLCFGELKAAKQIGLTIPPNVLVRASKVIK